MKTLFASLLLCTACFAGEPTPTPTPQWLIFGSTDPAKYQPGENPAMTFIIVNKYEVVMTQFGDGTMLTFKPKFQP